jgi:hypothetical protein
VIADYADDRPYPTALLLGFSEGQPLHVVAARDRKSETCVVVTAYRPDSELWSDDYRSRK